MMAIRMAMMPPVYPRVCGGTSSTDDSDSVGEGLSPRVRGNRGQGTDQRRFAGSIPACAGEPRRTAKRRKLFAVYPRVCGGTQRRQVAMLRR